MSDPYGKSSPIIIRALTKAVSIALACAMPALSSAGDSMRDDGRISHAIHHASLTPHATAKPAAAVVNCNDSGAGSLREAFTTANDGDSIDLSHLTCSTISLKTGLVAPATAKNIQIVGPADRSLNVHSAVLNSPTFTHSGSGVLSIEYLTISDGYSTQGRGGCIHSAGSVTLYKTQISGCTTTGDGDVLGGAIYVADTINVQNSSISGSTIFTGTGRHPTSFKGGGIWGRNVRLFESTVTGNSAQDTVRKTGLGGGIYCAVYLNVFDSTIDHNRADYGGGIFIGPNGSMSSTILGSTISSNTATYYGGGIDAIQSTRIYNATVTKNSAGVEGGGAALYGPQNAKTKHHLESSIISGNTVDAGGVAAAADISGVAATAYLSGANNLIGSSAIPVPSGTIVTTQAQLADLADNGGPTKTHALLSNSPAINKGNNSYGRDYDQRGAPYRRQIGPQTDIGAIEFVIDHIFSNGFDPAPPTPN